MRVKLDENLGRACADLIRSAGHDVETVASQRLSGSADPIVIEVCRREGRCLITLDVEFGNPLIYRPSDHHGIAVFRLPSRHSARALLPLAQTLVAEFARSDIKGELWIVQIGRIRKYQEERRIGVE